MEVVGIPNWVFHNPGSIYFVQVVSGTYPGHHFSNLAIVLVLGFVSLDEMDICDREMDYFMTGPLDSTVEVTHW